MRLLFYIIELYEKIVKIIFNYINLINLVYLINLIREKTKKHIKPYLYPTQVVK